MAATIGAAQYAFGLFVPPLEEAFGWSRTEISASLSFTAVGSLAAPLLGRVMDRHGARPILVGSLLLTAASFLLRPFMQELWHWYALSFLQYVAFSGATVLPTGRLIGIWFTHRRGRMMGIASVGPNFGGLVLPALVAAILSLGSWQSAYVALGLLVALVGGFAWLVVREFPGEGDHPRSKGDASPAAPNLRGQTVREATAEPAFYTITLATVLAFFTYGTVLPHVVVHLTNEGFSPARASFSLGTLALAGMVGKVSFGYLAERISARIAFLINLIGQASLALLLAWVAPPALVLVVPIYGFFMGGTGVLSPLLIQEFFGLKNYGSISGLISLATVISFGAGPLLAGVAYDLTGSYDPAFALVSVLFAVGAFLLGVTRRHDRAPP